MTEPKSPVVKNCIFTPVEYVVIFFCFMGFGQGARFYVGIAARAARSWCAQLVQTFDQPRFDRVTS